MLYKCYKMSILADAEVFLPLRHEQLTGSSKQQIAYP